MYQKGASGNPTGRPKSDAILADQCRKFTPEIVALMVQVMRGEVIRRSTRKTGRKGKTLVIVDTPTFQDRVRAAEWLTDRGWGKAPTVLAGPGGVGPSEIRIHWGEEPQK